MALTQLVLGEEQPEATKGTAANTIMSIYKVEKKDAVALSRLCGIDKIKKAVAAYNEVDRNIIVEQLAWFALQAFEKGIEPSKTAKIAKKLPEMVEAFGDRRISDAINMYEGDQNAELTAQLVSMLSKKDPEEHLWWTFDRISRGQKREFIEQVREMVRGMVEEEKEKLKGKEVKVESVLEKGLRFAQAISDKEVYRVMTGCRPEVAGTLAFYLVDYVQENGFGAEQLRNVALMFEELEKECERNGYAGDALMEVLTWLGSDAVDCAAQKSEELSAQREILFSEQMKQIREIYGEAVQRVMAGHLSKKEFKGRQNAFDTMELLLSDQIRPSLEGLEWGDRVIVTDRLITARGEMYETIEKNASAPEECALASAKFSRIKELLCKLGGIATEVDDINKELDDIIDANLDHLVSGKESLMNIMVYMHSGKTLPVPDATNIGSYNEVVKRYLKEEYGVMSELDARKMSKFFAIADAEKRKRLAHFLDEKNEKNVKTYPVSELGHKKLRIRKGELARYVAIALLGSPDRAMNGQAEREIGDIIGEEVLANAVQALDLEDPDIKRRAAEAVERGEFRTALQIVSETNNETLLDVVNVRRYKEIDTDKEGKIRALAISECMNPFSYDSEAEMSCNLLPSGGKHNEGIVEYALGRRFLMLRYDVDKQEAGSATCFIERGRAGKTLLVDSVEGQRVLRNPQAFEKIYLDFIERAKGLGVSRIVFNQKVAGDTARQFIEHLSKMQALKGEPKLEKVRIRLHTRGYLEMPRKKSVDAYITHLQTKDEKV